MKNIANDPLGHLKLSVSNFNTSKQFYAELFDKLEFALISDKEKNAGWSTKTGFGIWITQAEIIEPRYTFSAPGFHHLCLKAISDLQVDEIYRLMKHKTRIFDPPKLYPEYTDYYYAVFFADPDGMKIEVAYY